MAAGSVQQIANPALPDSVYAWHFAALSGDSWGGTLVGDSSLFSPGDTVSTAQGTYTILTEDERRADLSAFGLEDGAVFVEWYWDSQTGEFLPTRTGPAVPSGTAGLGSEWEFAWTGASWAPFGMAGQLQVDAAGLVADARFTWVFEAATGDRWEGVLLGRAAAYEVGSTVPTAHGTYLITGETALPSGGSVPNGTVQLSGEYFDNASGLRLSIQGVGTGLDHGSQGLGSEAGTAWNGVAWVPFGLNGSLQVDAPAEFRPLLRAFTVEAGGWASQNVYPRTLADANGDGRADVIGFGNAGVLVSLGNAAGGFEPMRLALDGYGLVAGGWASQDIYPRTLADVNGDGRADVVGFGNAGVLVSLADGTGGFGPTRLALDGFGLVAGGWASQDIYPRTLADVNGDGRADVVGFGNAGVLVSLADGTGGFGPTRLALDGFGFVAGGWASQDRYPRMMADVNGDGRADVVGFGNAGVLVSLADGTGGFGPTRLALDGFGFVAGGWSSQDRYPRMMADVNGDGRADVVGFGNAGVLVSLGSAAGGFGATQLALNAYGFEAGGWASQDRHPRMMADLNGDGRAEVVGFGNTGIWADQIFAFG